MKSAHPDNIMIQAYSIHSFRHFQPQKLIECDTDTR